MSSWNDNKQKTKDIFDSIRNFILSGAVFYIGVISFFSDTSMKLTMYLNYITGSIIILVSIFLFFINWKSFNDIISKEYLSGNINRFFTLSIPPLILLVGLHLFLQTALNIKVNSETTIKELKGHDLFHQQEEIKSTKKITNQDTHN